MTTATGSFEALPMPRKDIPQPEAGSYRVYKNINDYIVVEAGSALEALQASGMDAVYKVQRESLDSVRVLSLSAWSAMAAKEAADQTTPAAQADQKTPVADKAPAQAHASAELSSDEVNKLLNS